MLHWYECVRDSSIAGVFSNEVNYFWKEKESQHFLCNIFIFLQSQRSYICAITATNITLFIGHQFYVSATAIPVGIVEYNFAQSVPLATKVVWFLDPVEFTCISLSCTDFTCWRLSTKRCYYHVNILCVGSGQNPQVNPQM